MDNEIDLEAEWKVARKDFDRRYGKEMSKHNREVISFKRESQGRAHALIGMFSDNGILIMLSRLTQRGSTVRVVHMALTDGDANALKGWL